MQARFGTISASEITPSLLADLSWSGSVKSRVVASNSIGFGAILRPNVAGELVEADGSVAPVSPGVFIALEAGTGTRRVLYWGGGWVRNDAWTLTPGRPLYLSTDTPGELSHTSDGSEPVGFAESTTVAYFGPVDSRFQETDIVFTATGQTFEAILDVDPGATILWTFADATTSNLAHPTKDYGTAATRENHLRITPWSALRGVNIGYDQGDDGPLTIDLLAGQNVTTVEGLENVASSLEVWASSNNPLTALDFRGFTALLDVESMGCTSLDVVQLANNVLLDRICLEGSSVETLDISGCVAIRDARGGSNGMLTLTFGDIGATMDHVCFNQNPALAQLPDVSRFTTLNEFLMFGSNQSGTLVFGSPDLGNIAIQDNAYTSLDISTGCGAVTSLNANNNLLSSVDISNNAGLLYLDLGTNSLNETQVDTVLSVLDAYATSNGTLDLTGNVPPSAAGMASVASLQGRGWTVAVDSSVPYVTTYSPGDGETGVAVDTSMSMIFNEVVNAVSGNINLYDDTDTLVESFDVTSDITGSGTNTIGFTPASNLSVNTGYYVQIDAGAFEDGDSNAFPGIADTTTWNFTTQSAGSQLFLDDFNRADGPVGNNWLDYGSPVSAIASNVLELTHSGYAALYNMCSDALPADYNFQVTIPSGSLGTRYEWGVGVRCIYTGVPELDGIRVFFNGNDPVVAGNTKSFNADPITVTVTNGFPASWTVDQAHTILINCVGTTITITLDGQEYGYFTSAVNNQASTGIAVLGNPNGGTHQYDDALVTSV